MASTLSEIQIKWVCQIMFLVNVMILLLCEHLLVSVVHTSVYILDLWSAQEQTNESVMYQQDLNCFKCPILF